MLNDLANLLPYFPVCLTFCSGFPCPRGKTQTDRQNSQVSKILPSLILLIPSRFLPPPHLSLKVGPMTTLGSYTWPSLPSPLPPLESPTFWSTLRSSLWSTSCKNTSCPSQEHVTAHPECPQHQGPSWKCSDHCGLSPLSSCPSLATCPLRAAPGFIHFWQPHAQQAPYSHQGT